jgi:hypothetical protein
MRKILLILIILTFSDVLFSQVPYLTNAFRLDSLRRPYRKSSVPLITDLNRDGIKEIVFSTMGPTVPIIALYVLRPDGSSFPGFPKGYNNEYLLHDIASGDVNGDGYIDLVLRFHDKVDVIDRFGNSLPGFPVSYSTGDNPDNFVTIYDLDNDGKLEIITSDIGKLVVFNHNGTIRNGFPVNIEERIKMNPAVMDIDRDGYAEIITFSYKRLTNPPYVSNGTLYCFKHDGSQAPGNWPVLYDSAYHEYYASPSVYYDQLVDSFYVLFTAYRIISPMNNVNRLDKYDALGNLIIRKTFNPHITEGTNIILKNNNEIEYLSGGQNWYLWLFNRNFTVLQGWPNPVCSGIWRTAISGILTYENSNLVLAVDGADSGYGYIRAFNMGGQELSWSPLRPEGSNYGFSLSDLNSDGSTELIVVSARYEYDCRVSIFTFPGVPFNYENFSWSMYAHDRYKTNQFGFIPPDEPVGIQPITNNIPTKFILYQNYPNPFNPYTQIRFELPGKSYVRLKIYDALGREVQSIVDSELRAGVYQITFQSGALPSGVYFYRVEAGDFIETKKMVLIK